MKINPDFGDAEIADIIENRTRFRGDMPPEIRASLDNIVEGLIGELGESPEAWRGALAATEELINRPLLTYLAEERPQPEVPNAFIFMVMLVMGQFLSDERTLAALTVIRDNQKEANDG